MEFDVKVEKETILDLINTDHLSYEGELKANTYVTRYNLKPGSYHLITFEPKLVRYSVFFSIQKERSGLDGHLFWMTVIRIRASAVSLQMTVI